MDNEKRKCKFTKLRYALFFVIGIMIFFSIREIVLVVMKKMPLIYGVTDVLVFAAIAVLLYLLVYRELIKIEHKMETTAIELGQQKNIYKEDVITAASKQAEFLALQNQINPHFLYNTLEGIRGETLSAGLTHVAKMTEALSTYFRYTISKVDKLVTVEDELKNIGDYYIIQRYRFGERLNLTVEYDEENKQILKYMLPKLTLQPIVENAIGHGIEKKVGKGTIKITIIATKKRLLITVSDNGLGMSKEMLSKLNDRLTKPDTQPPENKPGGIAVVNVNTRIKLLFGDIYGISIYSVENSGTDVEITLPLVLNEGTGNGGNTAA